MPIWNRNKFKPLILNNLLSLDYPKDKLEFCIDDDGTEPFLKDNEEKETLKKLIYPIKLNYFYRKHKRSIGSKRNNLVKIASYKIIACMDSDDLYLPDWIKYAIYEMKTNNYSCVGSNQMIFLYPHHNFTAHAIRCESKRQIHEACMVFTKKHHKSMGGFKNSSQGEGSKMADFNEKNVGLLDIDKCMACICHNENTIVKDMFMKDNNKIDLELNIEIKNMIANILEVNDFVVV
jgi:glycosyltransferase involved in cell wall biosynthesis